MKLGDIQTSMRVRLKKTCSPVGPGVLVSRVGKKFDVVPLKGKNIARASGVTISLILPGQEGWIIVHGSMDIPVERNER